MAATIGFPGAVAANALVTVSDVTTLFTDTTAGYPDGAAGYGNRPLEW